MGHRWENCNYYWKKRKEHILMWIAWHLPKNIAYWCTVRVITHATQGEWAKEDVLEIRALDILPRWRPEKPINPVEGRSK